MRIVTFMSANDGAIARIEMPMPSKGGMKLGWNPVVVHAPTEDDARAKAQAFYDAELQRLASKTANMAEGRAKAAATRASIQGAA